MKLVPFITLLLSGLVAGLFYAYSCSVNPGLKELSNSEYVKAMQAINIAIQNPVFFTSFMGLLLAYPLLAFQTYKADANTFALVMASGIIYFVFVFGITAACNVPLNNQLAAFNMTTATEAEINNMRRVFENPWNTWHAIRTYASVLSFALLLAAFLLKNKPQ